MKKIYKTLCITIAISMCTIITAYASEIPQKEYFNTVKWYIGNEKINEVKVAPVINLKAMSKGMNLGYLDPKLKEIKSTKEEITDLVGTINATEITNDTLKKMNEELLTRLSTMTTYLERSESQYEALIGYDRHYIGKYFTLKVGEIFTNSADDNLKYYNKDYKEVKRIYKDIKDVMKDM
ncbi:MAG: hypothetical protein RSC26_16335 [Terrisporobacter sp.]